MLITTKVAGVTFEGRQKYLARIRGGEPTRLVPEPTNPYDANALAVHVSINGEVCHVGYVPKDLAARIAPKLDGEPIMVVLRERTGGIQFSDGRVSTYGLLLDIQLPDEKPQELLEKRPESVKEYFERVRREQTEKIYQQRARLPEMPEEAADQILNEQMAEDIGDYTQAGEDEWPDEYDIPDGDSSGGNDF